MTVISVTQLKEDFAKTTGQVEFGGKRIIVEKHRKPAFAMISIDDLKMLQALEDRVDALDAEEALEDSRRIPLDEVKAKLGF
jgi:PHD/YefM family antitoxin component YafN of YafNO toxin-antitoxin module